MVALGSSYSSVMSDEHMSSSLTVLEHPSATSETHPQNKRTDLDLEPERTRSAMLSGGQDHSYRIRLAASEFALVVVDPVDIELDVKVFGPAGDLITRVLCPYGMAAAQKVYIVASVAGSYRVLIRPTRKLAKPGSYEVKIAEKRRAKPEDRMRAKAQRIFPKGYRVLDDEGYRNPTQKSLNALGRLKESLQLSERSNDLHGQGIAHVGICAANGNMGEWGKSVDSCNRGLRIFRKVGDHRNEAIALLELGRIVDQKGDMQQALKFYEDSIPLFQSVNDRNGEYNALLALGELYRHTGELTKAIETDTMALSISEDLNSGQTDAELLADIGAVYYDMGETLKALDYYNRSLVTNRSAPLLSNVGLVYAELGQGQKAIECFQESLKLYRSRGDRGGEALNFNNAGLLYYKVGLFDSALENFARALSLTRAVRYKYGEGVVLGNIGKVHLAKGERHKALAFFNRALALSREIKDRSGEGVNLATIGEVLAQSGETGKDLDYFTQALAVLRETGDRRHEASALVNMGKAYGQTGDDERALVCYQQGLTLAKAVEDPFAQSKAMYGIAYIESKRGDLATARAEIESALELVETVRANVGGPEIRTTYLSSVREYYELYVDVLMRLEDKDPSKGFAATAFEASERCRARTLLETLTQAHAGVRRGVDSTLWDQQQSLQQLLDSKTGRLMRMIASQGNESQIAIVKKEIEGLLADYHAVEDRIRTSSPDYAALMHPQPLKIAEIQTQLLDNDTVLLEYFLGDRNSYLWAVTPDSLHSFRLPGRTEIEASAREAYDLLTSPNQYRKRKNNDNDNIRFKRADSEFLDASRLGDLILGPVAKLIRGKRLLIVADGALQFVPFAILPLPEDNPPGTSPNPLVTRHEIVELPSASVLLVSRLTRTGRVPAPKRIAVLADPVFDQSDSRVRRGRQTIARPLNTLALERRPVSSQEGFAGEPHLTRSVPYVGTRAGETQLSRLPFSRREAKSILAMIPAGDALEALDFRASRATALSAELSQYRIIHFATHGLLDSEHPELSGLVLSLVDERGRPINGFLDLQDIYNLNLPAGLVVLSACETALGKEIKGEGLIGLTRGFMYAGADRVIASLWKVDDAATSELMERFYKGILQKGLRPAAALRQAQIEMLEQPRWANPYYWGAFTIQGEWK